MSRKSSQYLSWWFRSTQCVKTQWLIFLDFSRTIYPKNLPNDTCSTISCWVLRDLWIIYHISVILEYFKWIINHLHNSLGKIEILDFHWIYLLIAWIQKNIKWKITTIYQNHVQKMSKEHVEIATDSSYWIVEKRSHYSPLDNWSHYSKSLSIKHRIQIFILRLLVNSCGS